MEWTSEGNLKNPISMKPTMLIFEMIVEINTNIKNISLISKTFQDIRTTVYAVEVMDQTKLTNSMKH